MTGKSRSFLLSEPYSTPRAYILDETRTAHQLAELELETTGWSIDWDTVGWLVQPGMLVRIDGDVPWMGQVISTTIDAAPAYVSQAVNIERYAEQ